MISQSSDDCHGRTSSQIESFDYGYSIWYQDLEQRQRRSPKFNVDLTLLSNTIKHKYQVKKNTFRDPDDLSFCHVRRGIEILRRQADCEQHQLGSGLKCFNGASTSRGLMKTARSCGWPASGPMPWRGSIATRPWARCVSPGGWKWLDDRCCSANQAPGQCAQLRLDLQCTIRAPSNTITLSSDRLKVSKQVRLGLFKIFFQIKCITFGEASKKLYPFYCQMSCNSCNSSITFHPTNRKKNKLILHDFCLWPPPIMVYLCNILFDLKTPYYSTHNKN